jgi:hypothetical protein
MDVSGAQQATSAGSKFGHCLVVRRKDVPLAARRALRDICVSSSRTTDRQAQSCIYSFICGLFDEIVSR